MNMQSELGDFTLEDFMLLEDAAVNAEPSSNESYRILFAVDASNSMKGYKIGAVNEAVNNTISELRPYAKRKGVEMSIAVVGFSDKLFRWTNGFVPITEFKYSYVEAVDGKSEVAALFAELSRLSQEFPEPPHKNYTILFSDGLPTSSYLEQRNAWKAARQYAWVKKLAVSFEEDMEDEQSAEFLHEFVDGGVILPMKDRDKLVKIILDSK